MRPEPKNVRKAVDELVLRCNGKQTRAKLSKCVRSAGAIALAQDDMPALLPALGVGLLEPMKTVLRTVTRMKYRVWAVYLEQDKLPLGPS